MKAFRIAIACMLAERSKAGTTCSTEYPTHCWDDSIDHRADPVELTSWTNLETDADASENGDPISALFDDDLWTSYTLASSADQTVTITFPVESYVGAVLFHVNE